MKLDYVFGVVIKFDGIQEAPSTPYYQYTCLSGVANGATFLSKSKEVKDISARLAEMIRLRIRARREAL